MNHIINFSNMCTLWSKCLNFLTSNIYQSSHGMYKQRTTCSHKVLFMLNNISCPAINLSLKALWINKNILNIVQGLEGGWGGGEDLIPHSRSFFENPTCDIPLSSCAQFWQILLPRSSQNPNPAHFFSEILDPENALPDLYIFGFTKI